MADLQMSGDVTGTSGTAVVNRHEIHRLLGALEGAAAESGLSSRCDQGAPPARSSHDIRLAQARLGLAGGLITALHYKNPQTAAHCCRVGLCCSAWAELADLDAATRDVLETAALLHDIGKIGVPDGVLMKPGRLTQEEMDLVDSQRLAGADIVAACCGSERVLDTIRNCRMPYAGDSENTPGSIPLLEARMIAIADAFDSMTTDQIYRPAMSREKALAELFHCAGTQFDPVLVQQFVELTDGRHEGLFRSVASKWLENTTENLESLPWDPPSVKAKKKSPLEKATPFEDELINSMPSGVVFVDARSKITLWSIGTENLTGVKRDSAVGKVLRPSMLGMKTEKGKRVHDENCPVRKAIESGSRLVQQIRIRGRNGTDASVEMIISPVRNHDRETLGAALLLEDLAPVAMLEKHCDHLNNEVTLDPMTKIANRGEFDRMLAVYMEAHRQSQLPCSLIIADIDKFKSINDTYGHQAGDEAIIALANLLKSLSRSGDLVARYGGEEFVVLCSDCNTAEAARRAEEMRMRLAELEVPWLEGRMITASFGVTELQAGDTPETMLRRSDRALLMAKEQGRNRVIQLGNGMKAEQPVRRWWPLRGPGSGSKVTANLVSPVPVDVAIEKLRGFVSDHQAKIVAIKDNTVCLHISTATISKHRREGDRSCTFKVSLELGELREFRTSGIGLASGEYASSKVAIEIAPVKSRLRRASELESGARLILQSLKAYLMAEDVNESREPSTV